MKKLIAVLTALGILTTGIYMPNNYDSALISITASAETSAEDFEFDVETGTITWYFGTDEIVEIPSEIDGVAVTSIGNEAFDNCQILKSIFIPDSVESIGDMAFFSCDNLISITIPESVTNIGNFAFEYTAWLKEKQEENPLVVINGILIDGKMTKGNITVPDNVTSIHANAFEYNDNLTGITLSDSVKSIGYGAFSFCKNLTSVIISDSVTSIGNFVFSECENLTDITIPNSVTSIGNGAFSNCSGLKSAVLSDSITSIEYVLFYECTNLESIKIPDGVTNICGGAFSLCSSLTSINIPDSVTDIDEIAFSGCTSLESISIPDSVESIGRHAFKGCSDLTRITIPDSVTSIGGGAFDGTPWLENMQEQNPLVIVNNILIDGKKCGQDVIVPDTVTSISAYAFKECSELTSITIPDSVTSIGGGAFNRCESLASIKGYRDSEAERYAKEFGFDFVALEKDSVSISYSNGDVTGDGIIDATDASFILTAYAKSSTNEDDGMNEEQRTFADVNNDDVVDAVDASTVLTYYARSSVDFKGTFEEYLDEFVFKTEINPDDYFKAEIKTHEISKDTYGNENLTIVFEFTNVTDETIYVNDNEIAPNGTWEKRISDKTDRWGSMIKHGGYIHYVFSDSEMNKMFSGGLFFKLDENLDVVEYRGFVD